MGEKKEDFAMNTLSRTVFADDYGYNARNATEALQRALDDPTAKRIVVRDMGTPWYVDRTVFMRSNKTIVFRPGVVVQAKPGSFLDNTRPMIRAVLVENVKFIGQGDGAERATFRMNKQEYNTLEFGHALDISGVTNFHVQGLRFTGAGGDGLYIAGAAPAGKSYSENGIVRDIVADNNRRQGLSILSVKDLVVEDSVFQNTKGTAPSAGIDLEPDQASERLQNIQFNNLEFRNNDGAGLKMALGNLDESSIPVSITANNLWIENNQGSGIALQLWASGNEPQTMVDGTIKIQNTQIISSGGKSKIEDYSSGILLQEMPGPTYDANNLKINLEQVSIVNSGNDPDFYNPIHIRGFGGNTNTQEIGNVDFKNVVVRDRFQRDIIQAFHGRPDGYLNQVSGNIIGFNPTGVTVDYDPETTPRNFSLVVRDGDRLSSPQLIRNGDFEQGEQRWRISSQANVVEDQPQHAGGWLKLDANGGRASQDMTDRLSPGENYVLTGRGGLTQLGSEGEIGVRYWRADGTLLETEIIPVKSTQTLDLSLGLTVPDRFSRAELFIQKDKGPGTLWVDEITLFAQEGGIVDRGF
jgi:hypothetical protein